MTWNKLTGKHCYLRQGSCDLGFVCSSVRKITRNKQSTNFDEISVVVRYVIVNSWLNFGGDHNRDAISIFRPSSLSSPIFHPFRAIQLQSSCIVDFFHWHSQTLKFYWLPPSPSIGLAVLCFYSKTGFWPSYTAKSQPIWIKFCTPIVVRDTLVGRLRPRSACGRLQAKPKRLAYVFL